MSTLDQHPLLSHLLELRSRLMRILWVLLIVFLLLFHWAKDLYHLLALPLLENLPKGGKMIATDPITPFMIPMKVAFLTTFLITLPHTLYQLWAFIAPGLYRHEKRLIAPLIASSTLLFFTGMSFAYFLVLPTVFKFMQGATPEGVAMMTDISSYLDFVIGLFLAFGGAFEVPVVVVILARMGIVTVEQLKAARSYVIVGAFVVAAIVTPPDVVSQLMLAIPLCLLFEAGLLAAQLFQSESTIK